MVIQEDYDLAVAAESFRSVFLEAIDLRGYYPYIDAISYCSKGYFFKKYNKESAMATLPHPLALIGVRGKASKILVFPGAFVPQFTLDDFLGCLLHHEGEHAKDFYENSANVINIFRKSIRRTRELKAYTNQMRRINQGIHSSAYVPSILERMNQALL